MTVMSNNNSMHTVIVASSTSLLMQVNLFFIFFSFSLLRIYLCLQLILPIQLILPNILALCLMHLSTYYAKNYTSIIGWCDFLSLQTLHTTVCLTCKVYRSIDKNKAVAIVLWQSHNKNEKHP